MTKKCSRCNKKIKWWRNYEIVKGKKYCHLCYNKSSSKKLNISDIMVIFNPKEIMIRFKGFLLLFVIWLFIILFSTLIYTLIILLNPIFGSYLVRIIIVSIVFIPVLVFDVYTLYSLFYNKPNAVALAKMMIILRLSTTIIKISIYSKFNIHLMVLSIIFMIFFPFYLLWYLYFTYSKKVKTIYLPNKRIILKTDIIFFLVILVIYLIVGIFSYNNTIMIDRFKGYNTDNLNHSIISKNFAIKIAEKDVKDSYLIDNSKMELDYDNILNEKWWWCIPIKLVNDKENRSAAVGIDGRSGSVRISCLDCTCHPLMEELIEDKELNVNISDSIPPFIEKDCEDYCKNFKMINYEVDVSSHNISCQCLSKNLNVMKEKIYGNVSLSD